MARFYAFLRLHPALWQEPEEPDRPSGPARRAPIIRLEDGSQVAPFGLELDDLPRGYQRDEGLAAALGMAQAVVEAAARALGIPPDVLRGLSQRPDLVEMVRRGLDGHDPSLGAPGRPGR